MFNMKSLLIALILVAVSFNYVLGAIPAGLVDDFSPVEGVVLMARDGEVLIDAEAVKGVRTGDLFSIVTSSEQVVHPQTGELLGVHRQTAGLLQVIQVRPGFSIAKQLDGEAPKAGVQVLRFEQVESRFFDLSDQGEAFADELRQALPQLSWAEYTQIDQAEFEEVRARGFGFSGLLFILEGTKLEVRSSEFDLLYSYGNVDLQSATAPVVVAPAVGVTAAAMSSVGVADPKADPLIGLWSGMAAKKQPVGLVVTDLDADGKQEIVRAFYDRVEIGRLIGEQYTLIQEIDLPSRNKGLSLSALDITNSGHPELIVSVAGKRTMSSQILEYRDGQYQILLKNLTWFLNVVDLPGEGKVLLGQERDNSYRGFAKTAYRMVLQADSLIRGEEFALAEYGTIFSLAALSNSSGTNMVRINDDSHLEVYTDSGDTLWVSEASGDSETGFEQQEPSTPSGSDEVVNETFLPTPILVLSDGVVLGLMNQGLKMSEVFRTLTSVDITLWKWDGIEMKHGWTQTVDGYVPAAVIADANNDGKEELTMILAFPTKNPFASRKSVVRLYEFR